MVPPNFLPHLLSTEKGQIFQGIRVFPHRNALALRQAPAYRGLVRPWWTRLLEERQQVLLRKLSLILNQLRAASIRMYLENFKSACDLTQWLCILAKQLSRKAYPWHTCPRQLTTRTTWTVGTSRTGLGFALCPGNEP